MPSRLTEPGSGIQSYRIPYCLAAGILLLTLFLSSCKSMGPKTIPYDGFNYNQRIADQENEQLLLNIVRLRYLEMPRFLSVASVINSYTRSGSAGDA